MRLSIGAALAAGLLSLAVFTMPAQASPLVKQAKKVERKLGVKSSETAYNDALVAMGTDDDATAIANVAASLGITVAQLDALAKDLFSQNGRSDSIWQAVLPGTSRVPPAEDQTYNRFGYDASFDAPNTQEQQIQIDLAKAEQLYRYALTIRHIGERKAILAEAAALGSADAQLELTFY